MFLKKLRLDKKESLDSKNFCLSNIKCILLIFFGIIGLFIFGAISNLIFKANPNLSQESKNGAINFVTYFLIFASFLIILRKDIFKFLNRFKNWQNILLGIVSGFLIISLQLGYSNIVNLFYPISASKNEESLRSFITVYPLLSILFLSFIGPFCEEMTYRVGIMGILNFNKKIAYVVSIVIFTLMHFSIDQSNIVNELINLPMYLLSATALTITYDKLGFEASYCAHVVNNLWSVIGIIIISNLG